MTELDSDDISAELHKRELDARERQEADRRAYLKAMEEEALEARRKADERRREEAAQRSNGEITDASSRYAQSLGEHYDMGNPYASLASAAMAEYGKFQKQQEELRQQAAAERNPEERTIIELRRLIERADYNYLVTNRLIDITRTATRAPRSSPTLPHDDDRLEKGDSPKKTQLQLDIENAPIFAKQAADCRAMRAELIAARAKRHELDAASAKPAQPKAGRQAAGTKPPSGENDTAAPEPKRQGRKAKENDPPAAAVELSVAESKPYDPTKATPEERKVERARQLEILTKERDEAKRETAHQRTMGRAPPGGRGR